jgi:proliferating cell nuclear antigen
MDKSHTILAHLYLAAQNFEFYECKKEKIIIGVNMFHLFKLINSIDNDDTLTIYIENADYVDGIVSHLALKFENGEIKQCKTQKLRLIEPEPEELEYPDVKFSSIINLPSADFQKICRDMTLLGSKTVEIKNVGSTLTFGCKGHFASRTTVMGDSENEFTIQKKESSEIVSGNFSLPHLVLFTKCTNLCNNLEIHMKNDWFLMIRYVVANLGSIQLCLMPCST